MEHKQSNKAESRFSLKGQRYWSVMLVGEHGRVIPFHRFKEVAIGFLGLTFLSLVALSILLVLYARQHHTLDGLQTELSELRLQAAQLRDEKDVLHAKLVIQELKQNPEATSVTNKKAVAMDSASQPPKAATAPAANPDNTVETPEPLAADFLRAVEIRQFEVDYDVQRELLKSSFRIYNTSTLKKDLSGRIVLVFKHTNDPPIKWMAVPNVPLRDGKPVGNTGQAFSVSNFRSMELKAFKPPMPIVYDAVTLFVFLSDGALLMSQDFAVAIKTEPPPKQEVLAAPTGYGTTGSLPAKPPSMQEGQATPLPAPEKQNVANDNAQSIPPTKQSQ